MKDNPMEKEIKELANIIDRTNMVLNERRALMLAEQLILEGYRRANEERKEDRCKTGVKKVSITPNPASDEQTYPCKDCGKPRTKDEGGTTFSVCEECWDKIYGKSPSPASPMDAANDLYLSGYEQGKNWVINNPELFGLSRERKRLVLDKIDDLINVQKHSTDSHDYHHGMLNGLILAKAIIEDKTPHFYTRPDGRSAVPSKKQLWNMVETLKVDFEFPLEVQEKLVNAIHELLTGEKK